MKNLCLIVFFSTYLFGDPIQMLQGKWKLESFGAFSAVIESENFKSATEEEKSKLIEVIDFSLNNTYYEFKGDTIIIDEGVIDKVERREVIFSLDGDKMSIFYINQIKTTDYKIIELTDTKLVLDVVYYENKNSNKYAVFIKVSP